VGKGRFFVSFAKYLPTAAATASDGYVSQRTIGRGGAGGGEWQRDRRGYENNFVAIVIFIIWWRRRACTTYTGGVVTADFQIRTVFYYYYYFYEFQTRYIYANATTATTVGDTRFS